MTAYRIYRLDQGEVTAALRLEAIDVEQALSLAKEMLGDDAMFEIWDRDGIAAKFPSPVEGT